MGERGEEGNENEFQAKLRGGCGKCGQGGSDRRRRVFVRDFSRRRQESGEEGQEDTGEEYKERGEGGKERGEEGNENEFQAKFRGGCGKCGQGGSDRRRRVFVRGFSRRRQESGEEGQED